MASIEKLGPNKYRIVVSNGYRVDGSKIRERKIVNLPDNLTEKQKETYNNWIKAREDKDFALADTLREKLVKENIL